jgi:hypothetical protein
MPKGEKLIRPKEKGLHHHPIFSKYVFIKGEKFAKGGEIISNH